MTTSLATRAESLTLAPPRKRWGEAVIKGILALCALVSVATTLGIVLALFLPAFQFFQEVNFLDYITGTEWAPLFLQANFGVVPLIAGTLSVTFWACLVAIPFGLGFIGVITRDDRRGFHDRRAGTDVVRVDSAAAPWLRAVNSE